MTPTSNGARHTYQRLLTYLVSYASYAYLFLLPHTGTDIAWDWEVLRARASQNYRHHRSGLCLRATHRHPAPACLQHSSAPNYNLLTHCPILRNILRILRSLASYAAGRVAGFGARSCWPRVPLPQTHPLACKRRMRTAVAGYYSICRAARVAHIENALWMARLNRGRLPLSALYLSRRTCSYTLTHRGATACCPRTRDVAGIIRRGSYWPIATFALLWSPAEYTPPCTPD